VTHRVSWPAFGALAATGTGCLAVSTTILTARRAVMEGSWAGPAPISFTIGLLAAMTLAVMGCFLVARARWAPTATAVCLLVLTAIGAAAVVVQMREQGIVSVVSSPLPVALAVPLALALLAIWFTFGPLREVVPVNTPEVSAGFHGVLLVIAAQAVLFGLAGGASVLKLTDATGELGRAKDTAREVNDRTCSFRLPAHWRVQRMAVRAESLRPRGVDHYVLLRGPDDAFLSIGIMDAERPPGRVAAELLEKRKDDLLNVDRTGLPSWGHFPGAGYTLEGFQRDGTPGVVTVFAWNAEGRAFSVESYVKVRGPESTRKELREIEDSFKAGVREGPKEEESRRRRPS
jgi:hypothetical protein